MVTILQTPDPKLREVAQEVPADMIGSAELKKSINAMIAGLESQDDAVAIAAVQIGIPLRIFIVSKSVWKDGTEHKIFINPTFIRLGRTKKEVSEGCLSVRWKYGMVKRATTATIRAWNEKGNEFVMRGQGLLAQIFQHEMDHLDGVLFIDKANHIEDMPPGNDGKQ